MRPDEKATQNIIERQKQSDQNLKSGIKTAANIGLTAAGITGISKIAPFLSEFIPEDLALKGIKKVSPKLGSIIESGVASGLSVKSGFDFLKDQLGSKKNAETQEEQKKESPPDNRNAIQKYSPSLSNYIKGLIENGSSPAEAAAKSKKYLDKPQLDLIKKMEDDYKSDWLNIVESIFGKGDMAQNQQQIVNEAMNPPHSVPPNHPLASQQQAQQGIDPQLAQILQQGQSLLQKFRGGNG